MRAIAIAIFAAWGTTLAAQNGARPLDPATLSPDASAISRIWREYLDAKAGRFAQSAGSPSTDWLESEQRRWPVYDLAGQYLPDGVIPEILSVDPEKVCGADDFRITTRFRMPDNGTPARSALPFGTVTVFAVRDAGRWQLANALPRNTCTWRHATVGTITYVYAPDYPYNGARARQAVAFADSIATVFKVPGLDSVSYYLAASVDEMYATLGLQLGVKYGRGAVGGLSQPINRMLFSGNPIIGEDYRHELAHLILAPLCCARTSYFVSEGVPTWLGGTSGEDFPTAARGLATFLTDHPAVSLDSILSGTFPRAQFYAAGAVFTAVVFEHGGVPAVKALFDAGGDPDEFRASLERLLGRPWPDIVRDWRRAVMKFAGSS